MWSSLLTTRLHLLIGWSIVAGKNTRWTTLQLHISVSLNRPPDRTWRRPPGRPRNNWLNSTRPTGELWRRAVVVVVQRRDGPRWLRDHDDDDATV